MWRVEQVRHRLGQEGGLWHMGRAGRMGAMGNAFAGWGDAACARLAFKSSLS